MPALRVPKSSETLSGTFTRLRSCTLIADRLGSHRVTFALHPTLPLQVAFSIAARYLPTLRFSLQFKRLALLFCTLHLASSLHQSTRPFLGQSSQKTQSDTFLTSRNRSRPSLRSWIHHEVCLILRSFLNDSTKFQSQTVFYRYADHYGQVCTFQDVVPKLRFLPQPGRCRCRRPRWPGSRRRCHDWHHRSDRRSLPGPCSW